VIRDSVNLDDYVSAVLVKRLGLPSVREWITREEPPDLDEMRTRLSVEQSELASWRRLAKAGDVSAIAFSQSEKAVLARIAAIKDEMKAAVTSPLLTEIIEADDIESLWDSKDLAWRRAVVSQFVTVTVLPGAKGRTAGWKPGQPYFDTTAIQFQWKPLSGREAP
jgi:hypothetical protein